MKKKVLDERQTQAALRSIQWAFRGVLLVLGLSLMVKVFFLSLPPASYATEFTALLVGCAINVGMDLHQGIYDIYSRPGFRSYFLYSLISALFFTAIVIGGALWRGAPSGLALVIFAGSNFLLIFVVCYAALALYGVMTKRRQHKLDQAFEEDEEE